MFLTISLPSLTPDIRSFNETARDDCELTEEQAANMRFVPEGEEHHFSLQTDPTLTISNRVKEIADLVEKQLIEDDVSLKQINASPYKYA